MVTAEARREAADGARWYADRDPSSVPRFRRRFRELVLRLSEHPGLGERVGQTRFRRIPMSPFPYLLIYEVDDEQQTVTIVAVPHAAQSAERWARKP